MRKKIACLSLAALLSFSTGFLANATDMSVFNIWQEELDAEEPSSNSITSGAIYEAAIAIDPNTKLYSDDNEEIVFDLSDADWNSKDYFGGYFFFEAIRMATRTGFEKDYSSARIVFYLPGLSVQLAISNYIDSGKFTSSLLCSSTSDEYETTVGYITSDYEELFHNYDVTLSSQPLSPMNDFWIMESFEEGVRYRLSKDIDGNPQLYISILDLPDTKESGAKQWSDVSRAIINYEHIVAHFPGIFGFERIHVNYQTEGVMDPLFSATLAKENGKWSVVDISSNETDFQAGIEESLLK